MKLRFQFERLAFQVVTLFARILPRHFFLRCGRAFGRLAFRLDKRHRLVALENYRHAYPESKNSEEIIRKCYEFFSSYLFDMLASFPRFDAKRMKDYEINGLEYVEQAYKKGKGAIFFAAHYGAWELNALAQAALGFPLGLLVRRLDNPYLEELLERLRCSNGNFTIDKKQGFRPMLKALREGKVLAFLMDQNVTTEDRVFVNFFGRPASTTPAVALLKLKTDCELIPVSAYPLDGDRYHFSYGAPVEVPLTGNREQDVLMITQECTSRLEAAIREHPAYWLWMHRRWKTQPKKESNEQSATSNE
jgi:Kdo2-lipid IVA lauroyltransferase/acyltransferase